MSIFKKLKPPTPQDPTEDIFRNMNPARPSPPPVPMPPGPEENSPETPPPPPGPPQVHVPETPKVSVTGNAERDILSYLRQHFPRAFTQDLTTALPQLQEAFPGLQLVNNGQSGKIQLPNGQIVDIGNSFGVGGGVGWQWLTDQPQQRFDDGGMTVPTTGFLPPQTPTVSNTPTTSAAAPIRLSSTTSSRGPADQAFANRIQEAILQMLNRGQTPSASDPEIALPSAAFRQGQQRMEERSRAELAERAAHEGYSDSGAFDTELRGIQQARGQAESAYEAGLFADAAQRRLTELTQVAALGSQFLSQQDQLQLQREIANLEAQLEQARLAQNQTQFTSSLGENRRQFDVDSALRKAIEEARLNQSALMNMFGAA